MSDQDNIFERLSKILISRKETSEDNSYTGQLYEEGIEKIIAKTVSYTHLTLPTKREV